MLVRAPLVETQQDGSIRIENLTKVVMARSRFGLPKERLVPFEAERNVSDADDCPCALHLRIRRGPNRRRYVFDHCLPKVAMLPDVSFDWRWCECGK